MINKIKQHLEDNIELTLVRSSLLKSSRKFFDEHNYLEVSCPTITGATGSCESVSTTFNLDYFGKQAYLIQTSQLHLEAFAFTHPRIYSINRSYRAEPKIDNRRLCEFTLVEFETRDMNLEELIDFEEAYLRYVFAQLEDFICSKNKGYINRKYPRITYDEAITFLKSKNVQIEWGDDLKAEHEKVITKELGICFVTHYPKNIKFFNMEYNRENPDLVNCVDLLLPGVGESMGGSVREFNYEEIKDRLNNSTMLKQLQEKGGLRDDFEWYLDLFKDEEVHRAGCGIGFERIIQFILGKESIVECIEFPRNACGIIP
jgi:asparaginyl-tRNA synthetase